MFKRSAQKIVDIVGDEATVQVNPVKVSRKEVSVAPDINSVWCETRRESHCILYFRALQPGRGNFVVSISGQDEPVVSLLGMKRPFSALRALDMEATAQQVLDALDD